MTDESPHIFIRSMVEDDILRVVELEKELFGASAWSQNAVLEELHGISRYYYVAYEPADSAKQAKSTLQEGNQSSNIVGYAGLWFDGDDAEIMTIGVDQRVQGKGIGTQLLATLRQISEELAANRMLLEVRVDNEPALTLYRKNGFEQIGVRKRYYQSEDKDAYTMAAVVKPKISEAKVSKVFDEFHITGFMSNSASNEEN